MNTRFGIAARHLVFIAGLVLVIAWLLRLDLSDLGHDTTIVAFALVRVAAVAFAVYLLVLSVVGGVAHLLAMPRTSRAVDRLTVPFLRAVLGGAAALGVMTAPASAPTPPSASPTTTIASTPQTSDAQATLHLLTADPHGVDQPPPVATDDTWTVQPGECFWSIAASQLAHSRGAVSEQVTAAYWRRLIDANRARLANPDDPDLLFANQELVLPPVDAG